ncbi:hypothetical protein [uncultured Selenomonas sp.]|uniref:hypothetical protein n=1 Tax=uncultured Selenomonas sp. TaxID=159275 RepID=UPI0028EFDDAB|nr:hypothetical protein [uncultured Selenomonas sp.]
MTRLVRLNEVQYAETEEQEEGLKEQGFCVEGLPEETPVMSAADEKDGDKNASDGDKKGGK